METKKYLYAAVGAQVAVVKAAQAKLEDLMAKLNESATSASSDAKSRIDTWAGEGEEFLGKVGDTKAIDELTSKVDFDQMQTQVHKLRDQLEDIVSTWRANFRPETKTAVKVTVTETATEAPTATASKTSAAKTPAAKTAAAKTTTTRTTAAKTTAAKKPAAKKPAAKATATKATTAKKPAAKKPAARQAS
jgi:uncharacterized coiled-coil protein SlyX